MRTSGGNGRTQWETCDGRPRGGKGLQLSSVLVEQRHSLRSKSTKDFQLSRLAFTLKSRPIEDHSHQGRFKTPLGVTVFVELRPSLAQITVTSCFCASFIIHWVCVGTHAYAYHSTTTPSKTMTVSYLVSCTRSPTKVC